MYSGSTSNLRRHLQRKHPTVVAERQEQDSRSWSPSASSSTAQEQPPQSGISRYGSDSDTSVKSVMGTASSQAGDVPSVSPLALSSRSTPSPKNFTQPTMRQFVDVRKPIPLKISQDIDLQLLKVICNEYQPFSVVENEEFRKFVKMLNPSYQLPSRKTISYSLLPSAYNEMVEKVKLLVQNTPAVCLTCDGWTDLNNVTFYAITAHFFDDNTNLKSALLDCSEFPDKHTADNIARWLRGAFEKYDIGFKLCAVVTDNAANIKAAVASLNLRHISCFAHSLNLAVQSAISSSIKSIVDKVKSTVQFFKRSSHATAKLHEMQKTIGKTLKLKQDVPTRWNSTYVMLERFLYNKEPIIAVLALVNSNVTFAESEWGIIKQAVDMLGVFFEVTVEVSASKTVSLSKIGILDRGLRRKVKLDLENKQLLGEVRKLGEGLLTELTKRFGVTESIELVGQSIFLDPRFKKQGFGEVSRFQETYNTIIMKARGQIMSSSSRTESGLDIGKPEEEARLPLPPLTPSSSIWNDFDESVSRLQGHQVQDAKALAIIEADKYLAEPLLPRNLDPLVWWDERKRIFPNLYQLVLKRLCIQATSVPCERIFSKAGQLMTEKRSRLTSQKLTQMLFINSNSKLV